MAWHLTPPVHRQFRRNPLEVVTTQLKFHPILKIAEKVPDYQEQVRHEFPMFAQATTRAIQFQENQAQVSDEPQFQFAKQSEPTIIALTKDAVTLTAHRHHSREIFQTNMDIAVAALMKVYSSITPARLGLRYVNAVRREAISSDLGEEVKWEELITERFLRVPSDLADLNKTLFACEVQSGLLEGTLTLRYGLLANPDGSNVHFRLDMDRFMQGSFDVGVVSAKLKEFSDDIHAVFLAAAGPALLRWMGEVQPDATF